jgi:hypothetical protein
MKIILANFIILVIVTFQLSPCIATEYDEEPLCSLRETHGFYGTASRKHYSRHSLIRGRKIVNRACTFFGLYIIFNLLLNALSASRLCSVHYRMINESGAVNKIGTGMGNGSTPRNPLR